LQYLTEHRAGLRCCHCRRVRLKCHTEAEIGAAHDENPNDANAPPRRTPGYYRSTATSHRLPIEQESPQDSYSFAGGADGMNPSSGLLMDYSGNLDGVTESGGTGFSGIVFRVD
jgi:hypothetical protein